MRRLRINEIRLVLHVAGVLLCNLCVTLASAAQDNSCQNPCRDPGAWSAFNIFELSVTISGQPGKSSWKGRFDSSSDDIQLEAEFAEGTTIKRGGIMMIGGRVLAVRGPITEPGSEIDSLDEPVLYYQLVTRLLGTVLPNGPKEISGTRGIDFKDEKTGIQFATPSAQGFIQAPWRVTGQINVLANEEVEYDLTLASARNGSSPTDFKFAGRMSKIPNAKIDDAMSLDGWNIFGVGVQTRQGEQGTTYDYGAGPATATYKTVADVRKKIAQDDYPGELDRSRDFTGFWKTNCEDAFGLSIAHFGTDGKYTVTFCGPGGCGDPAEERKTFINKDPEYEVVSATELKVGDPQHRDIYHKCTTDTHPILKYKNE